MTDKPSRVQIDNLEAIKTSAEWIDYLIDHFMLYIGSEGTVLRKEDINIEVTRKDLIEGGCRIESAEGGYYKMEPDDHVILMLPPDFIQEYGYGPLYLEELNQWFLTQNQTEIKS